MALYLWPISIGGTGTASADAVATDPSGNAYVTGSFGGKATFGAGEVNETALEAAGTVDLFVAKYARNGMLIWATSAGGFDNHFGNGIATDPGGNSYVTGSFEGTATFGAGEAHETVLEGMGTAVLVAKYARDGTLLWARAAGASGDYGLGIATDPRGNSYVSGQFDRTARFGAGEANETVLEAVAGSIDMFVAKYARDGTLLWAMSGGGPGFDSARSVATDLRGNGYVTGSFQGAATFGAGEANQTVLEAVASVAGFVAKYAKDGTLVWATSANARIERLEGRGIATDLRGNSYVGGLFTDLATFGVGEANETTLESAGLADVFLAKYRP